MTSHLHFMNTRSCLGDLQPKRAQLEGKVIYGYSMLYGFKSQLNVTLPEEMYKAVVANCGSLTKLVKVVKCLLKMICRTPKYKDNKEIQLTAEAFASIVKSSQSCFPPDLKQQNKG